MIFIINIAGRMMKRWSCGAGGSTVPSPYMTSVSSTTITSLPNKTRDKSRNLTPNRSRDKSRKSQSRDSHHVPASRDKSDSHDARSGSARVGARSAGAKKITVSASDNALIVTREGDQIARKTAANLKNPRSKRFVQSVWTEEFCKLMDLRMYSH